LNCRIFPRFFIGKFPKEKIKEVIDPSHMCMHSPDYDAEEQKRNREYSEYIGKRIMEEYSVTEKFFDENGLKQDIVLPASVFPPECPDDIVLAKQITEAKISLAMALMKDKYSNLVPLMKQFAEKNGIAEKTTSIREINEFEARVLSCPRQKI
jgi:hypothetical protein